MPASRTLLSRQIRLLAYLTSGPAIFGEDVGDDEAVAGIDPALLHLAACFSHNKRMEKIFGTLPRSLAILGNGRDATVTAFVFACPQAEVGRLENTRQFRDFLFELGHRGALEPPHVAAVAALELAVATARTRRGRGPRAEAAGHDIRPGIRRGAGVELLHCPYDLRPIFEDEFCTTAPVARDTLLAITFAPGMELPQIFELTSFAYDLIAKLDDWTNPDELGNSCEIKELLSDLNRRGLIESSS